MSHAIATPITLLRSAQVRDQVPGREIYRLIRAFGFACRRDSGSEIGERNGAEGIGVDSMPLFVAIVRY